MILHLFNDEKVVNRAMALFNEALPDENIFVCKIDVTPKYVKECQNLHYYTDKEVFDSELLKDVDQVVVHMLTTWKIDFINKYVNKPYKLYWMVWGGDMYNGLIAHWGYDIYYEHQYLGFISRAESFIKKVLHRFDLKIGNMSKVMDFISRVDYFKTSWTEFEIQKKYLGKYIKGQALKTNINLYYCLEDVLGQDLLNKSCDSAAIQVGNSASLSANHNYAFKYLRKLDVGGRKIIAPLGYGGNSKYIQHIIEEGKHNWGDHFYPVVEFLELKQYNELMLSTDVYIFGNWRQEAVGNILIALYLGAKVFLSRKSPLLKYYLSLNLVVFCLEDIKQSDIDNPLDNETRELNREIVRGMLDKNNIIKGIKTIWG